MSENSMSSERSGGKQAVPPVGEAFRIEPDVMDQPRRRGAIGSRLVAACAVAVGLALLAGCDISRPEIRLRDVEIAAYDFEKIELTYVYEVTNPNAYIVTLWGFDFRLISAGEELARSALAKPVTSVPTGGSATVRAPVTIRYADVPPLVARADAPSFYGLNGSAGFSFLGNMRFYPFTHAGMIPPLRQPSWRFVKLRLASREEGIVELSFDVTNPATMPLPMGRLAGALRRGDKELLRVDRIPPGPVPAGKTARLVVPVKIAPAEAIAAAAAAEAAPRSLQFEGSLELLPPAGLKAMLLGQ